LAISSYGEVCGTLTKSDFRRAAFDAVCDVDVTDNMVDIIFYIFDINIDGNLSMDEFLAVLERRERDIAYPIESGIIVSLTCWWKCAKGAGLVTASCVHWKEQTNPGSSELLLRLIYIQIISSLESPVTVSGNTRNYLQALVTLAGGRRRAMALYKSSFGKFSLWHLTIQMLSHCQLFRMPSGFNRSWNLMMTCRVRETVSCKISIFYVIFKSKKTNLSNLCWLVKSVT